MKKLATLLWVMLASAEGGDPFAKFLREGNVVTHRDVKVVLDERGVPFKWSRRDEISCCYRDGHYLLSGRGRFEKDALSKTAVLCACSDNRCAVKR